LRPYACRTIFVHYNKAAGAPDAIYIDTNEVQVTDSGYVFDTGFYLSSGHRYNSAGQAIDLARPQQMFTPWYGFANTFPNCEIYRAQGM